MARVVVLVLLVAGVAASVITALLLGGSPSATFTYANAVLVLGYLLYPVLMLVGPTLLVVALLIMLGTAIERRRSPQRR